jgi:hypothetical protein
VNWVCGVVSKPQDEKTPADDNLPEVDITENPQGRERIKRETVAALRPVHMGPNFDFVGCVSLCYNHCPSVPYVTQVRALRCTSACPASHKCVRCVTQAACPASHKQRALRHTSSVPCVTQESPRPYFCNAESDRGGCGFYLQLCYAMESSALESSGCTPCRVAGVSLPFPADVSQVLNASKRVTVNNWALRGFSRPKRVRSSLCIRHVCDTVTLSPV